MIIYKCDMCGAEFDSRDKIMSFRKKIKSIWITVDICDRCIGDINKVHRFLEEKDQEQT